MMAYRDEDDDKAEAWADSEADYGDDSEDEPTVACPYCRREILEDTPRCPYCERYISAEDHARSGRPLWVIIAAVMCLAVAVWWVFAAF